MSEKLLTKEIKEEIEFGLFGGGLSFANYVPSEANGFNFYYPVVGGAGGVGGFWAYWYWMQTAWFNRFQRYGSRVVFMSNAIAETLINSMVVLILGEGFKYQTPDPAKQKLLDKWVKDTKWKVRNQNSLRDFLVDGECFLWVGNDGKKDWVRFIDPDFVHSSTAEDDRQQGIIHDPDDYETVKGYVVHRSYDSSLGKEVSADQIQHRKNGRFGSLRGFSWLLNILTDLTTADRLTNSLGKSAEVVAKFALFRVHKANQSSVEQFRDNIQANQPQPPLGQNGTPPVMPNENIERYADGSIVDVSDSVDLKFPEGYSAEGFVMVLESILRKIASKGHLNSGIFNLKDANESYNSGMVRNSFIVRAIQAFQSDWIEYDMELLEKAGFDTSDISIIAPEVSIVDIDSLIKQQAFLMGQNPQGVPLISHATVSKSFGIDPQAESAMIAKEPPIKIQQENKGESIDTDDGNDTNTDRRDATGTSGLER